MNLLSVGCEKTEILRFAQNDMQSLVIVQPSCVVLSAQGEESDLIPY
jgi:hypothetical protein